MAQLNKIDSNVTGLRYAEEGTFKTLTASPVWKPLEPNSYTDFGGSIATVARNPINAGRQRKKGVTTDLDAGGGFDTDLTQTNLQDLLQGFFFANLRRKTETFERTSGAGAVTFAQVPFTAVNGAGVYTLSNLNLTVAVVAAGGTGYNVGDVLTLVGGTFTQAAQVTVLTAPGGVVGTVSITRPGRYTVAPGNPVATTGGGANNCTITATITAGALTFVVGQLVFHAGFTNATNNGLKRITAQSTTTYTTAEASVVESPTTNATSTVVGVQAGAGDLDIDNSGSLPALTSTTLNLTTLGLIPGEWIFIGGDLAANQFDQATNNGFKRVRTIVSATRIEFDKSVAAMITENNAADTIQIFFGRVLKNEVGSLIIRRTYNLERTLGAPDDAQPSQIQAEYLEGAVPGEFKLNVATADKVTAELTFVAGDNTTKDGPTGVKSGTRPSIIEADAFNTSSDVSRIKMHQVIAGNPAPTPLFAFVTDMTINLNNNISPNKAIGVLGAFEVTAGTFEVGGELTAYFGNVSAIQAVRNNLDVTIDVHFAKANSGISIDLPLISLGDGRPNVEQDAPITLPIQMPAATGAKIDANLDYTMLMVFWDYLPTAAM